jgi:hypothetical protein
LGGARRDLRTARRILRRARRDEAPLQRLGKVPFEIFEKLYRAHVHVRKQQMNRIHLPLLLTRYGLLTIPACQFMASSGACSRKWGQQSIEAPDECQRRDK